MTEFKVGDRVRVTDGESAVLEYDAEVKTGWIGQVKESSPGKWPEAPYRVIFLEDPVQDSYGWWMSPDHLELIEVTEAPSYWEQNKQAERVEFSGGGMRDSQDGKPRFDLLMPESVPMEHQFLTRCAVHMTKGAEKYEVRNWEQFSDAEALDRAKASACRHFFQWVYGETDEDHAAAVFFNVMAAEFIKGKLEEKY